MKSDEFQSIQEILDKSPAMKWIRERPRFKPLEEIWKQAAGEKVAKMTRATRYKNGKLTVEVFSAPLHLELASFRKQELVARLREEEAFKGILDIVFKAG